RVQGRELLVRDLERRQEVLIRLQRVELLARELVALRPERHAERLELGTVGVEAARERLVGHLRVALDVRLDVPGGERPPLRHQERDERQLPDQLVRVVAHPYASLRLAYGKTVSMMLLSLTRSARQADYSSPGARTGSLCRDLLALEVLVRRAVLAVRERCALARLALPRGGAAARDSAVERP